MDRLSQQYQQQDDHSIDEIEDDNDEIQCEQCGNIPDNYVKLDCSHKFCLICLAYVQLQSVQSFESESNPQVSCSICGKLTPLDPETIQALQVVIQDVLLPLIQQAQMTEQTEEVGKPQLLQENNNKKFHPGYSTSSNNDVDISNTAIKEEIEEQADTSYNGSTPQSLQQHRITNIRNSLKQNEPVVRQIDSFVTKSQNTKSQIILKERAEPYLGRLQQCFQLKMENLEQIQQSKMEFYTKSAEIKELINNEFQQIIVQIEQQRGMFLNDLNYIETVYVMQLQKEEQAQEFDLERIQSLNENLTRQIQRSITFSSNQQIIAFQNLLLDIERVISDFSYLGDMNDNNCNSLFMKLNLKCKLFTQKFRVQATSALENNINQNHEESNNESDNRSGQSKTCFLNEVASILNSFNDSKRGNQQKSSNSKFLKNFDQGTPTKDDRLSLEIRSFRPTKVNIIIYNIYLSYEFKNKRLIMNLIIVVIFSMIQMIVLSKTRLETTQKSTENLKLSYSNQKANWKDSILEIFDRKTQQTVQPPNIQTRKQGGLSSLLGIHNILQIQQQRYIKHKDQIQKK